MTSPATNPGTVASGAAYRCTACGREFAADSQALHRQPSGGACASILEPVGVVIDLARDDRAGVTLPLELVGGGELVPVGAGQVEGEAEAIGHKDSMVTSVDPVHASPRADLAHADARSAS